MQSVVKAAAEFEAIVAGAERLGLTRNQVTEIVTVWQQTPWDVGPRLQHLVVMRANGLPWRPPKDL